MNKSFNKSFNKQSVYEALLGVPHGKVITYGDLAKMIGIRIGVELYEMLCIIS